VIIIEQGPYENREVDKSPITNGSETQGKAHLKRPLKFQFESLALFQPQIAIGGTGRGSGRHSGTSANERA
jgi:hypothetical protein